MEKLYEPEVLPPEVDLDSAEKAMEKRVVGRPFQKGQSGNPAGRPKKGRCISTAIYNKLSELCPYDERPAIREGRAQRTWEEVLLDFMFKRAISGEGDAKAMAEIFDRAYGKAKANVQVEVDGQIMHAGEVTNRIDASTAVDQFFAQITALREKELGKRHAPKLEE